MKRQTLTVACMAAISFASLADNVWTYSDCVEYARSHNISLQKMRLAEESAGYDLDEAKAQWQPSLDFATSQGYTNSPWNDGAKNYYNSSYGFSAGWTVWNGGERENTIKRNRIRQEISTVNTNDALRTLQTDLLQVYLNILYAKESIAIYEEAVALSGAQADRCRQLMEAGKVSRVDYAQLNSQYEQDRYALVNAQGVYDSRRMELKKLLELGIDNGIELADVMWNPEQVLADLPPMSESFNLAVATDLTLQGLNLEKESSQLDIAIAKAGSKPKIMLNAGVSTGYSAPGISFGDALKKGMNETVGLTLSVPILDNRKTHAAVARAKVQELDAALDIDQRHTDLAQSVENWYIDTRSAQSRFTAATQQLESALITDELTNAQFDLGLVNTIDLMTSHNNLVEARHTLLQAKYMAILGQKMIEFYRTANITLN